MAKFLIIFHSLKSEYNCSVVIGVFASYHKFDENHVDVHNRKYVASQNLSDRIQVIGGDMFKPFPDKIKADCFFLKKVLHDFPDEPVRIFSFLLLLFMRN